MFKETKASAWLIEILFLTVVVNFTFTVIVAQIHT